MFDYSNIECISILDMTGYEKNYTYIVHARHLFIQTLTESYVLCSLNYLFRPMFQIHGSRDSVANIDLEGASTSVGPSDAAHLAGSSTIEDTNEAGVEIIHYQPPQVEYHETPATLVTDKETSSGEDAAPEETHPIMGAEASPKVAPAESMESVHSAESESNELQSLMPTRKDSITEPELEST